jgi:hypothetical protein
MGWILVDLKNGFWSSSGMGWILVGLKNGFWRSSRMDFGAAQEWILVELENGILVWSSGMDFGDFGVELRNGILVELSLKLRSNPVGGGDGGDSSAMVYLLSTNMGASATQGAHVQ